MGVKMNVKLYFLGFVPTILIVVGVYAVINVFFYKIVFPDFFLSPSHNRISSTIIIIICLNNAMYYVYGWILKKISKNQDDEV